MKKVISLLLASLLAAGMMVSCGNGSESSVTNSEPSSQTSQESSEESSEEESSEEVFEYTKLDTEMNIAVLKGPTGLGALKLMQDNEDGTALLNYNFSIHGSPEEIVSKIATGELDVAAVASNLASTLYAKTEKNVEILAVNTLGILYVMQKGDENITSLADLKGKTIISSGQGTTAQYVVEYLLAKNGIDPAADVTIEYKSEHSEVVATLATMDSAVAILPQPFVTTAQMQDENLSIALDLNQEWEAVTGEKLPMGCIIARKDYIAENPEAIETFLY